jgi:hypothetical protein
MARPKTKSIKELHITAFLHGARYRAKRDSVPFCLTKEYLLSIATDECPIFHTLFEWGPSGLGAGNAKPNGPTLDRIEPDLGYVEGNVAFISYRANRLKDNGTMQDHYDIADWLWTHLYAKKNAAPPVPKRTNLKSRIYTQHGLISPARIGQDFNNADNYSGATRGKNSYHSAKEGSGDSMGRGMQEVGPPSQVTRLQDNGDTEPKVIWVADRRGHIPD